MSTSKWPKLRCRSKSSCWSRTLKIKSTVQQLKSKWHQMSFERILKTVAKTFYKKRRRRNPSTERPAPEAGHFRRTRLATFRLDDDDDEDDERRRRNVESRFCRSNRSRRVVVDVQPSPSLATSRSPFKRWRWRWKCRRRWWWRRRRQVQQERDEASSVHCLQSKLSQHRWL